MGQGAASYRKIGGNLQGEPRAPVDATATAHGRGQRCTDGDANGLKERVTTAENGQRKGRPVLTDYKCECDVVRTWKCKDVTFRSDAGGWLQ